MEEVNFTCEKIKLNGEQLQGTWKNAWKKLKVLLKLKYEERRIKEYKEKQQKVKFTVGKMKDVTSGWSVIYVGGPTRAQDMADRHGMPVRVKH